MKTFKHSPALGAVLLVVAVLSPPAAAQVSLRGSVFGGGGGIATGPNHSAILTVGQPAVGSSVSNLFQQGAGFTATVIVKRNRPPVADAGDDQTIECADPAGTPVRLDGSGSSDPDGDLLSYTWTDAGGTIVGTDATPLVTLPPGAQTLTLIVEDLLGQTDTDEVTVTIEDTSVPVISVIDPPQQLWPPVHTYHSILLDGLNLQADDTCDGNLAADVIITSATSDEPEDTTGDGMTLDDMVIAGDCRAVELRAERQGGGNGRVYTIDLAVADASGNVGVTTYEVHVPHDEDVLAINDGATTGYMVAGCEASAVAAPTLAQKQAVAPTVQLTERTPATFALHGNYPNPFNPQTTIRFDVPERVHVRLYVFNVLGRMIVTLVDEQLARGPIRPSTRRIDCPRAFTSTDSKPVPSARPER